MEGSQRSDGPPASPGSGPPSGSGVWLLVLHIADPEIYGVLTLHCDLLLLLKEHILNTTALIKRSEYWTCFQASDWREQPVMCTSWMCAVGSGNGCPLKGSRHPLGQRMQQLPLAAWWSYRSVTYQSNTRSIRSIIKNFPLPYHDACS